MTKSKHDFTSAMSAWLTLRIAREGIVIAPETPLFGSGLIDSIRILELIAYTERSIGRVIPDSAIRMDNFSTVARIAEVFIGEVANAAA